MGRKYLHARTYATLCTLLFLFMWVKMFTTTLEKRSSEIKKTWFCVAWMVFCSFPTLLIILWLLRFILWPLESVSTPSLGTTKLLLLLLFAKVWLNQVIWVDSIYLIFAEVHIKSIPSPLHSVSTAGYQWFHSSCKTYGIDFRRGRQKNELPV